MSVNSKMTALADEIRELSGTSEAIGLDAMKIHVNEANDEVTSQVELLAQAVAALEGKATGSSGTQATPVISVNSSTGLITATAGAKTSTHQLAFQPAKTITPSTASQIAVSSGYYTGGNITVAAVPTQIKTVTPTLTTQNITPDSGKFLSKVTVNAIPSTYVKPSYTKVATTYTPTTTNQIISAGTYLTGTQTIKGDANLVADNIKSGVSIFGVSGTLEEGSGGSGEQAEWSANEDAIVTRTLSSYYNDRITSIGTNAFDGCSHLTTVSFPVATNIGANAFAYCLSLTTVSFPACISIGNSAFVRCYSLTTVSFPVATSIGINAFSLCSGLTTVSFPVATNIGNSAFDGCSRLTTASFPVATSIGTNAFAYCSRLTTVSFPVATNIGANAFNGCSSLTTVSFPACISIGDRAFAYCSRLTTVSFPVATKIGYSAFYSCFRLTTVSFPACISIDSAAFNKCYNLKSLYLTGSSLCKLSNSYTFGSTPIDGYSASAGTYGSIYVPASLLTSYKTATNWTYFSRRFVAYDE